MEASEEVGDHFSENQLFVKHRTQEQYTLSVRCSASGMDRTRPVWDRMRPMWGRTRPMLDRTRPMWASGANSVWRALCACVRYGPDASGATPDASDVCTGVVLLYEALCAHVRFGPDASGVTNLWVRCCGLRRTLVGSNDYFSNGREHRTLAWPIPDASVVN